MNDQLSSICYHWPIVVEPICLCFLISSKKHLKRLEASLPRGNNSGNYTTDFNPILWPLIKFSTYSVQDYRQLEFTWFSFQPMVLVHWGNCLILVYSIKTHLAFFEGGPRYLNKTPNIIAFSLTIELARNWCSLCFFYYQITKPFQTLNNVSSVNKHKGI